MTANVAINELIHDVATMDINAPTTATKNDVVDVQVTVDNLGGFEETFDVTLTDTTDSVTIGVRTVVVAAGGSQTESFSWDTSASSEGDHTLEAEAGAVPDESDLTNNMMTANVNIQVPSNEPAVVSITNPANDSKVNGRVTITATVSGFSGSTTVKFLVDGSLKKTLTSAPYEYGWHTKGEAVGPHSIEVQASDTNVNSDGDVVTVHIEQKGKGKPSKKVASEDFGAESFVTNYPELKYVQTFDDSVVILSSSSTAGQIIRQMIADLSQLNDSVCEPPAGTTTVLTPRVTESVVSVSVTSKVSSNPPRLSTVT